MIVVTPVAMRLFGHCWLSIPGADPVLECNWAAAWKLGSRASLGSAFGCICLFVGADVHSVQSPSMVQRVAAVDG